MAKRILGTQEYIAVDSELSFHRNRIEQHSVVNAAGRPAGQWEKERKRRVGVPRVPKARRGALRRFSVIFLHLLAERRRGAVRCGGSLAPLLEAWRAGNIRRMEEATVKRYLPTQSNRCLRGTDRLAGWLAGWLAEWVDSLPACLLTRLFSCPPACPQTGTCGKAPARHDAAPCWQRRRIDAFLMHLLLLSSPSFLLPALFCVQRQKMLRPVPNGFCLQEPQTVK